MKIIITGATGLLGRALYRQLREIYGEDVIGLGFSRANPPLVKLNLFEKEKLSAYISAEKPDCIIHCAAERRPDVSKAEPVLSERLNVQVTEQLAELSESLNSFMLYISTDYVFDGKNPPYSPDSTTNPLNFYGKTKLAGEIAVKNALKNFVILRVAILYGGEIFPTESSISSIADSLTKNKGGEFDDRAIRYPTHTNDVSRVISEIVKLKSSRPDFIGTYHWSGDEALTKFKMARIMASYLGIDPEKIKPLLTDSGSAKRPLNSHLDCTLLEKLFNLPRTSFTEGIRTTIKELF